MPLAAFQTPPALGIGNFLCGFLAGDCLYTTMTPDRDLIQQYVRDRSETAFSELVHRHMDLVYASALRLAAGDTQLAQDVSQSVFFDLARKARALAHMESLTGLLHTATRYAALDAIRKEQRRRAREDHVALMNESDPGLPLDWDELRPVLDDAVGRLKDADRDAVLLRFFEGRTLREVGKELGVSENAARMRVDRALEKLRDALHKAGLRSSLSALSAALACHASKAAPIGLAATFAGSALKAGLATNMSATLLSIMTTTQVKIGVAAAVLMTGIGTSVLVQQRSIRHLQAANSALIEELAARDQAPPPPADSDELQRLRAEHAELIRLRGQVGLLRRQLAESQAARPKAVASADTAATVGDKTQARPDSPAGPQKWELGKYLSSDEWMDAGTDTPENSLQTLFWGLKTGGTQRLAELTMSEPFVSDETPEQIREQLRTGKLRMGSPAQVVSTPPDYSQLQGGEVALIREKSPREIQLNVNETWADGHKVQSVWILRAENGQWKLPQGGIPGLTATGKP